MNRMQICARIKQVWHQTLQYIIVNSFITTECEHTGNEFVLTFETEYLNKLARAYAVQEMIETLKKTTAN